MNTKNNPATDTALDNSEADPQALAVEVAAAYESQLRFLRKWERGLKGNEAPKILKHNREHPIVSAVVTVLREWREEAMELLVDETQPEAQLRERVGYVRALRDVEEGILNIQMVEEVEG